MATWQIFNSFREALAEGDHDLSADTLKVALTNTAPLLSNAILTDISQLAAGNGYVAGGTALADVVSDQSGGTYSLSFDTDLVFTAAGGTIGPFRYLVLYNDTAANNELIGFLDYGTSYTLPDGQPFTLTAGKVFDLA